MRHAVRVSAIALVLGFPGASFAAGVSGTADIELEGAGVSISFGGDDGKEAQTAPAPREASKIPPGHMPPAGTCRIWFHGREPGQQPPPGNCRKLRRNVPPGATLVRG